MGCTRCGYGGLIIDKKKFQTLVKEIVEECEDYHGGDIKFMWRASALGAIQEATEGFIVEFLEMAHLNARFNRKRVMIKKEDLEYSLEHLVPQFSRRVEGPFGPVYRAPEEGGSDSHEEAGQQVELEEEGSDSHEEAGQQVEFEEEGSDPHEEAGQQVKLEEEGSDSHEEAGQQVELEKEDSDLFEDAGQWIKLENLSGY